MPFFTLYSNAHGRTMFVHARNESEAFRIFAFSGAPDTNANLEDGFVVNRVYDSAKRRWTEMEEYNPEMVDLASMSVNRQTLSLSEAKHCVFTMSATHGLKYEISPDGEVLVAVKDLPAVWRKILRIEQEDLSQAERDQRDQNKVYQAHDLRGLAAIIQKQLDAGRGQWQIRRASDPTIKPETVMSDPEGVSIKIGDGVIWIDHYQAE